MTFLNPWALLLALLSVPLVLLYFLKLKRPQLRVASTLLWQKVIEDMRVNSPFQKLRRSLLLILQLIILAAIVLALARPLLNVRDTGHESLIVLVDNSASMNALEEGGKTRLELARQEIGSLVESLGKDDEMMIVTFNTRASVACGFSSNRRQLREMLAGIKATDCSTSAEPALLLAKSIANSRSRPRVLLFSDGAFTATGSMDLPVDLEYRKVGTSRPNLAITGLDVRRSINDREKIEMFVAVENFSDESFSGNMAVSLDDRVLDTKFLSIGAQEKLSQIFEAILPAGETIHVKFETKDALACDNEAWKIIPPPVARRVLVVGDNTFFVERAFKSSPGVLCKTVTAAEYRDEMAKGCLAVIWNAVPKPSVTSGNHIYLGCVPEFEGLVAGAKIDAPDILDWDNSHPVNRFLDYNNLIIASAQTLTLPAGAGVLLRSTRTALIGMLDTGRGSLCVAGFDPMQSNWPLLLSFPLFLNACLDYFEEQESRRIETNIPAGKSIIYPVSDDVPVVSLPDGATRVMVRGPGGDYSFNSTEHCGVYKITAKTQEPLFVAVNLFNRDESLLDAADEVVIGKKIVQAADPDKQSNREYWKYILMVLGLVLVLEWIVYHRRIFV